VRLRCQVMNGFWAECSCRESLGPSYFVGLSRALRSDEGKPCECVHGWP
jgi:hypothetical protein